jgi:putative ABC transport system permease protein
VGDRIKLKGRGFEVMGVASPPLGGQASDIYVKLAQLQRLSQREGRSNTVYVRAASAGQVDSLSNDIERTFEGSQVTTSQELADRVGGSLVDAKDLSERLGAALTIVGQAAAFLIASLLTLASVAKRVRELGTLKAVGWPQRLVVRQALVMPSPRAPSVGSSAPHWASAARRSRPPSAPSSRRPSPSRPSRARPASGMGPSTPARS